MKVIIVIDHIINILLLKRKNAVINILVDMKTIPQYRKLIFIEDNSENLASVVHLCLTLDF